MGFHVAFLKIFSFSYFFPCSLLYPLLPRPPFSFSCTIIPLSHFCTQILLNTKKHYKYLNMNPTLKLLHTLILKQLFFQIINFLGRKVAAFLLTLNTFEGTYLLCSELQCWKLVKELQTTHPLSLAPPVGSTSCWFFLVFSFSPFYLVSQEGFRF